MFPFHCTIPAKGFSKKQNFPLALVKFNSFILHRFIREAAKASLSLSETPVLIAKV
jgi:hypothetical protein